MARFHEPVLLEESINLLNVKQGERYIDATVGGGGHSLAILKNGGKLLAIDCDPEAIRAAGEYLTTACPVPVLRRDSNTFWQLARGNFRDLKKIAKKNNFSSVSGILFDLGVSSYQLKKQSRGFSYSYYKNSKLPLDMRMDPDLTVSASDLVNGLTKGELSGLFSKITQEHYSGRIAEAICRARRLDPIRSTRRLAEIISRATPKKRGLRRLDSVARCFLALRVVVNDELGNLKEALLQARDLLRPEGRLVVISFHSGEDGIVKRFFKKSAGQGVIRIITKKPLRPTPEEIRSNPRSRSAKLRAGEKC